MVMKKKWKMRICIFIAAFFCGVTVLRNAVAVQAADDIDGITVRSNESAMVSYTVHVQKRGWIDSKYNGESAGTTGSSLRLEGLKIKVSNIRNYSGDIEYRSHVQTYGWEKKWVKNGQLSGTQGEAKRLEAVQIRLTGELAKKYDVYYRVHSQTFGWLGWTKNGEKAGTAGYSKRLEAIQIMLVDKGLAAPGNTGYSYLSSDTGVSYQTHMQTYGWMSRKMNGEEGGVVGQSKRLESINIALKNSMYQGSIEYQTHVQTYGWENGWKKNGENSGTQGQSKRLEAIRIRLTGELAKKCDVYYRVHTQHFGWLGWAKNGESAGTAGYSYRMEGIQIMVLPKNARTFDKATAFVDKNGQSSSTVNTNWQISKVQSNVSGNKMLINNVVELSSTFTGNATGIQCVYSWKNETTGETGTIGSTTVSEKVSWTPTISGQYTITVTATDASGKQQTNKLSLKVEHGMISKGDAFFTAHRGLMSQAPENSIPAFELAGQAGFDSIETDVNETKDGIFVISHDSNLSSICGMNVNISDLTYSELLDYQKYHIIKGKNVGKYTNQELKIPRLEEFLDICATYGCIPQLDTKNLNSVESLERLYQILEERQIQDQVIMTSFNNLYLQLLREKNPNMELTYGIENVESTDIDWLTNYNVGISVNSKNLISGVNEAYLNAGVNINVYSVQDKATLGLLMDRGIKSFTVNDVLWDK